MKEFVNADCMDYLKNYPDKYFDLAIVDPPYGDAGVKTLHWKTAPINDGREMFNYWAFNKWRNNV